MWKRKLQYLTMKKNCGSHGKSWQAVRNFSHISFNPLSTKKIPCKLSHWGLMDPSLQKTYEPKHLTQSIKITLRTVKNEQFKHKNK